ncbi:hypothetical protein PM10SUCC1_02020 [Propionigenium maris DSM 9537]|uniref:SHSP domain-containing protein n=1 Tax=Propionigenium maris DSM 9537 TaxID=1123000 RepID=A0A9W6GJ98_9FUSO|nr:Hsp20/alpha crystallin family protein [Propionigenium maris]GLI54687.1 hypothetical protein PM10SUCC1_02020 [Propionigenium maris DSM 9537]
MANRIKKYDIFNPGFLRDFLEDDFLTDSFFHRRLTPPVNIWEGSDSYVVEVSTPGIKKEDIKIRRKGNVLTISYDDESREYNEKNYHRKEFQRRSFSRSLNLPEDVEIDKILSEYRDGILTISIPKSWVSASEDEIIDIEIK